MLFLKTAAAETLFIFSLTIYGVFWIWALMHAVSTPRASTLQKILWGIAIVANPSTTIWYWYVWKRKIFWTLFTPLFGFFISLPFIARSLFSKADATTITNALFALGSARLIIVVAALLIFPLMLRLAALLHLGKNTDLTAMDRNDWIISLALPIFGFGAGMAYCARYRRRWAIVGLAWGILFTFAIKEIAQNVSAIILPAGEEKREEMRFQLQPSSSS